MKKVFCLYLLVALAGTAARADSGGADWSTSYGFPGAGKHQTNMSQADMIAKRESGYYDGLGKSQVYNITTTSIGTMTTSTTSITGNSNNVAADSISSGSLDASVQLQTLISSTQSKTR